MVVATSKLAGSNAAEFFIFLSFKVLIDFLCECFWLLLTLCENVRPSVQEVRFMVTVGAGGVGAVFLSEVPDPQNEPVHIKPLSQTSCSHNKLNRNTWGCLSPLQKIHQPPRI